MYSLSGFQKAAARANFEDPEARKAYEVCVARP